MPQCNEKATKLGDKSGKLKLRNQKVTKELLTEKMGWNDGNTVVENLDGSNRRNLEDLPIDTSFDL